MKLRVAFGAGKAVLGQQKRMVEVHRSIGTVGSGIDVHHLEIVTDRPRFQSALENDGNGDLVDGGAGAAGGKAGVEREGTEPPCRRRLYGIGDLLLFGFSGWQLVRRSELRVFPIPFLLSFIRCRLELSAEGLRERQLSAQQVAPYGGGGNGIAPTPPRL